MRIRWHRYLVVWFVGVAVMVGCASPAAPQGTPDISATVRAAVEQTRAVEVAVATSVAATTEAQQGATAEASPSPDATTAVPPTNTPIPTATPTVTPTPTPTVERLVIAETAVDGSDGDGREILISDSPTNGGRVILLPNFQQSQVRTPMVFGNYVTARVAVADTRLDDPEDGDGIRHVLFEVFTPTGDTYSRTEDDAPFCLFGGNDPACPGIDVRRARDEWPNGQYAAAITIEAIDGLTSNWNWTFCIHTCEVTDLPVIEFAQIGRDSLETEVTGELVFQVRAFQEAVGSDDGDGIDYVDFYIFGPDDRDNQVWNNREEDAAYCAFGGDAPCPGAYVQEPGRYWLVAVATDENGQQAEVEIAVDVWPATNTVPNP